MRAAPDSREGQLAELGDGGAAAVEQADAQRLRRPPRRAAAHDADVPAEPRSSLAHAGVVRAPRAALERALGTQRLVLRAGAHAQHAVCDQLELAPRRATSSSTQRGSRRRRRGARGSRAARRPPRSAHPSMRVSLPAVPRDTQSRVCFARIARLLELAERALRGPRRRAAPIRTLFARCHAFRWDARHGRGRLRADRASRTASSSTIWSASSARWRACVANTEQFLAGLPSNHVLLFGERGTGKSSAVKGLLARLRGARAARRRGAQGRSAPPARRARGAARRRASAS